MKRTLTVTATFLIGTLLVSCATHHRHPPPRDPPPSWTQCPKMNDSVSMYRIGTSTAEPTAAAAREAAFKDALRQISQAIMREIPGPARGAGAFPLNGAEIIPGCSYVVQTDTGYDGWVQVSFPLAEKIKLIESLTPRNDR